MTDTEMYERVTQLETVTYGIGGHGGLMQQVDLMQNKIQKLEQTVNTINIKLVILWGIGTFIVSKGAELAFSYLPKLVH